MDHNEIISHLKKLENPDIAAHSQRFFKTGKGEYGDGDVFLGIRVPVLRKAIKLFRDTNLTEIKKCLRSEFHEVRLFTLLLMVHQFSKADESKKEQIFNLYLRHTKYINNWDLVDSSAHHIVGAWLFDKDRSLLYDLAQSRSLWERRIAILATYYFIKNNQYADTTDIAKILLHDPEDLMHKAVGWMLREVGNRNLKTEEEFLTKHYKKLPRTMLRYAIEKFEEDKRQAYLKGRI